MTNQPMRKYVIEYVVLAGPADSPVHKATIPAATHQDAIANFHIKMQLVTGWAAHEYSISSISDFGDWPAPGTVADPIAVPVNFERTPNPSLVANVYKQLFKNPGAATRDV